MHRYLPAAVAAVGVLIGAMSSAVAQQSNDGLNRWMTINNVSHNGIAVSVYAIPAGASCCWSRDLLGNDIILPGGSYRLNFDDGRRTCNFNIRITSEIPGSDWSFPNVNVCARDALNLR